MQSEQKNVWIAMAIIIVMFVGWQVFYELPRVKHQQAEQAAQQTQQAQQKTEKKQQATQPESNASGSTASSGQNGTIALPNNAPTSATTSVATGSGTETGATMTRAQALALSPRVPIRTPSLNGSIALIGSRIDDLTLVHFHTTVDPKSPEVVLLSPSGAKRAYFGEFGWLAQNKDKSLALPNDKTKWTSSGGALTPDHPITLTWDNGQGLTFERTIAVDANYLFTLTQRVINHTDKPITLLPYGLVMRQGLPPQHGRSYIMAEGGIGVFSSKTGATSPSDAGYRLKELKYTTLQHDVRKQRNLEKLTGKSLGGWLGFTDKYWLTALVPNQTDNISWRFSYRDRSSGQDIYQADYLRGPVTVPAGGKASVQDRMFAGAEVVSLLEHYDKHPGIPFFGRLVFSRADYTTMGFYLVTEPLFKVLEAYKSVLGNFGLAILALTLTIKLLFFPLANKSYRAMSKMRALGPEMQKLRERYKDDKAKQQQELMGLYRKEKVNPASGCLPLVIQIPVFIALYQVLISTIEMRHAPFYGWIHDLSAPDPTVVWNLFGLLPYSTSFVPHFLAIGAWPLIMAGTMFLQQRISPQPPDPTQAKIMMFMPLIFLFLFNTFPAGLVIYWTWNNLLSVGQQWLIMRQVQAKSGKPAKPPKPAKPAKSK